MKAANADWVALIKRGIDKSPSFFSDQDIQYILEDLKFVPKGSNKELTIKLYKLIMLMRYVSITTQLKKRRIRMAER